MAKHRAKFFLVVIFYVVSHFDSGLTLPAASCCKDSGIVLDCANCDLTVFPTDLLNDRINLTTLDLSHNNISHIPDGSFQNLISLKMLKMTRNRVVNYNKQTFRGLECLEELEIGFHREEIIAPRLPADVLIFLVGLKVLRLSYKFATEFEPSILRLLTNLHTLQMSTPAEFHLGEEFKGLINLRSLMILDLDNPGEYFDMTDTTFENVPQLEELQISNVLRDISRTALMEEMVTNTKMTTVNQKSGTGKWTRVNRNNTAEKSIIDYILTQEKNLRYVTEVEIDEIGTKRLKGKQKESDHNTITMKFQLPHRKETKRIKKWDINEDTKWDEVNKYLEEILEKENRNDYKTIEQAVKKTMEDKIGKRTITIKGNSRRKETQEIKELRRRKKDKKKQFESASREEKNNKLNEYYEAQTKLRMAIEENEKRRIKGILEKIAKSKDKNEIWSVRKRMLGRNNDEFDTITEEGSRIESNETAKEHIARYYEDLYRAREGETGGEMWTETIKKENRRTAEMAKGKALPPITTTEMKKTQKSLKRRKSCGPDEIPNEIMINASSKIIERLRRCFNHITRSEEIPLPWKKGRIVRLYKGKGEKGKCSSERGITVGSNVGKLYERIINERAKKELKISDQQGGGKKGANTVDHLLILQELQRKGQEVYVAFLDVTKAYDKAWAEGIMYVMAKQGVRDKIWTIIRNLNEGLSAFAETKYGNTREIHMKDNIRQGGVLSVIMYAVLMDEIAKEIKEKSLGVEIENGEKLGCLLWMDDVALISRSHQELQEMLDITHDLAKRYRIKFGEEKSKVMKIGKEAQKNTHVFKLGDMVLEQCNKYKYLGVTLSEKRNYGDHLAMTRGKVEAAYNTIMAIAGSTDLKEIELKTIWTTLEACIIPIITYGTEAGILTKREKADMKQILDNILKRIIMTPRSTPWEPVYLETGILDIESTVLANKIGYMERIKDGDNETLKKITDSRDKGGWGEKSRKEKEETMGQNWIPNGSEERRKHEVKRAVKKKMMMKIRESGQLKSKTTFYLENKLQAQAGRRAPYMDQLPRREASAIFAARTRMLDVKANFKNKYPNTRCRMCNMGEETQQHILEECEGMDRTEEEKVTTMDIFTEEVEKLRDTAKKINKIKDILKSAAPQ